MRRLFLLCVITGLAAAAPAHADFHPACDGGVSAGTSLAQSAGTLTFSGRVTCNGADTIEILSLTIQRPDGSIVAAAPAACTACSSLVAVGSIPAEPGGYTVRMQFRTIGNGQSFSPRRESRWYWGGSGNPIQITSWRQLCDGGTNAASATVGLASEGPTGLGYNGSVRCVGADAIQISALVLDANGQSFQATQLGSCSAPCPEPVEASGSSAGAGAGRYTVRMSFGVERVGLTFGGEQVQNRWFWAGAGPPQQCIPGVPAPAAFLAC